MQKYLIIAGNGIRLAGAVEEFRDLVETFNIPFVTTKLAVDIMESCHHLYKGRIGIRGDIEGNKALKEAEIIISIGARLSVGSIGYNYDLIPPMATLVVVDIDRIEHLKPTLRIDRFIEKDAKEYIVNILGDRRCFRPY